MFETSIRFVVVVAFVVSACGKDDAKKPATGGEAPATKQAASAPAPAAKPAPAPTPAPAPAESTTVELDTFGYQIDVPGDWTLNKINDNAFSFRIPSIKRGGVTIMPSLTLMKMPKGPATAEDAAKKCTGTVGDKQDLEGALYYTCEQEAAGQKLLSFEYYLSIDGAVIHCAGSGADLAATLAACQSLKQK